MIVRSGNAVSFLVEFPSGQPDGDVSWSVLDPNGLVLEDGLIVVPAAAVSVNVAISGVTNTLAPGSLTSYRDLLWTYTVGGQIVNDERRYNIEARVPFGASTDGVRSKLGVMKHDLPDSEISLVSAYLQFIELAAPPVGPYTDRETLLLRNAIEALAALAVIPTMQVRIAEKESSGTDTFQRQEIDWNLVAANLEGMLMDGILVLVPTFDPVFGFGALFILAPPSDDPFPGG